jgi:Ca-activated chloride channel family protein
MLSMKQVRWYSVAVVLVILPLLWAVAMADWSFANLWRTPDQQAQRLFNQGLYAEAAKRFSDPMRQGMAAYRAGDFKAAAAAFARYDTPEAVFNRGNALVMSGQYAEAITNYDRALQLRPDWTAAQVNRSIAVARRDRLTPPEDDAGGTGGQLEADAIVFDNRAKTASQTQEVDVGEGDQLSDDELRALWLRRVQTQPADFLRAKFSYQLSQSEKGKNTP